jgi:ligand-binding sensor domain-containing protein
MRKAGLFVASGIAGVLLVSSCFVALRIHTTLKTIARDVQVEGEIPFDRVSLRYGGEASGARGVGPGFLPLLPSNRYTTGTVLNGRFYLAGPGGLEMYDGLESQPKRLVAGIDLPPAPPVAVAAGRLRGDLSDSLLVASHGYGLLILDTQLSGGVQLLPRDPAARDITAVLPLGSGEVLLGTRHAGLLAYDGKTLKRFLPALRDSVTSLAGDEADLWIGTQDGGVLHWRGGQLARFDTSSGLPDNQVEDIAVSQPGVFVGTPLGLAEFVDGLPARVLGKGLFTRALAVDGKTLVIATMDQGVREFPLQPGDSPHLAMREGGPQVRTFLGSADGLFAVMEDGTVVRHTLGGGWQSEERAPPQALADRDIASLAFGPDGRLWIGYFDRGVDVLDLGTGRADHFEDDHVFCINRIVPDPQRLTMDIATANGLVLFDDSRATPRVRQVLSRHDGLISDQITDVAFSRSGAVVATPAGLTFLTPSGPQSIYAFQGLVNNHVYTLATDPENMRVIAGTLGGISLLDNEAVLQNVTLRNSAMKRNWVTAVVQVPESNAAESWFVGTYGGGVVQMDSAGHVSAMESAAPQAVINPNAMLRTSEHVFAGTLSDGLLVYNRSSHRWSTVMAGLPSRNVTALAERGGELYVGTDNGIVHVAEGNLP